MTEALKQILADSERLNAAAKAHREAFREFATVSAAGTEPAPAPGAPVPCAVLRHRLLLPCNRR